MLPDTSEPGAEILPSVIVSVERVSGSQLPLFVTTVTLHNPSYGVCAIAGAANEMAETKNAVPMRLTRMTQVPDVCDEPAYPGQLCLKFAAMQGY